MNDIINKLNDVELLINNLENQKNELKNQLIEELKKTETKNYRTDKALYSLVIKSNDKFNEDKLKEENEEVYIILKGNGKFQVDDKVFLISEGSIVRVNPEGKRSMINLSNNDMIYIVVQAKQNSLKQWTLDDGKIENIEDKLKK